MYRMIILRTDCCHVDYCIFSSRSNIHRLSLSSGYFWQLEWKSEIATFRKRITNDLFSASLSLWKAIFPTYTIISTSRDQISLKKTSRTERHGCVYILGAVIVTSDHPFISCIDSRAVVKVYWFDRRMNLVEYKIPVSISPYFWIDDRFCVECSAEQ